jgi:alpha-ketoglutarate-dependent taurine dioxygenase
MALDALSDAAGVIRFPSWGPVDGHSSGLVFGDDPVITLFKPGFQWLRIHNEGSHEKNEKDRIRRFLPNGHVYVLKAFRGTDAEWLEQLKKAGNPAVYPMSDEMLLQFRVPYLDRLRRVQAELQRLPNDLQSLARRQMPLYPNLQFLEKGSR